MHDDTLKDRLVDALEGRVEAEGAGFPPTGEKGWGTDPVSDTFPPSGEKGWG